MSTATKRASDDARAGHDGHNDIGVMFCYPPQHGQRRRWLAHDESNAVRASNTVTAVLYGERGSNFACEQITSNISDGDKTADGLNIRKGEIQKNQRRRKYHDAGTIQGLVSGSSVLDAEIGITLVDLDAAVTVRHAVFMRRHLHSVGLRLAEEIGAHVGGGGYLRKQN